MAKEAARDREGEKQKAKKGREKMFKKKIAKIRMKMEREKK
jgi:hypothetical protein